MKDNESQNLQDVTEPLPDPSIRRKLTLSVQSLNSLRSSTSWKQHGAASKMACLHTETFGRGQRQKRRSGQSKSQEAAGILEQLNPLHLRSGCTRNEVASVSQFEGND